MYAGDGPSRGWRRYLSDEGPADSAWLYRLSFRAQFTIQDSLGAWYGDSVPPANGRDCEGPDRNARTKNEN